MLARLRQEVSTAAGHPLVVAADFFVLSRLGSMDFGAVSDRAPFRGSWNEYSLREDVFWYLSHIPGAVYLRTCVRARERARARAWVRILLVSVRAREQRRQHARACPHTGIHVLVWCGRATSLLTQESSCSIMCFISLSLSLSLSLSHLKVCMPVQTGIDTPSRTHIH